MHSTAYFTLHDSLSQAKRHKNSKETHLKHTFLKRAKSTYQKPHDIVVKVKNPMWLKIRSFF